MLNPYFTVSDTKLISIKCKEPRVRQQVKAEPRFKLGSVHVSPQTYHLTALLKCVLQLWVFRLPICTSKLLQ